MRKKKIIGEAPTSAKFHKPIDKQRNRDHNWGEIKKKKKHSEIEIF